MEPGLPDFDALWNYRDPAATRAELERLLPRAEAAGDRSYRLQLLTQLARTHSLQRAFPEAHALLDRVEAELEGAPAVVRARYSLERGRAFNSAGERPRAAALFEQAWQAAQGEELEFHAVDAAHMLGIACDGAASLAWNERAIAAAERARDPRARGWLGALYNNVGWTYHDLGRFADALAVWEKALAWRLEQGEPESIRIARWTVARGLRSLGRVEDALARQRELLEAGGAPDGFVHEELAECLLLLGRPDEARPHFARAHELLAKVAWFVADEPARLQRLRELGGVE